MGKIGIKKFCFYKIVLWYDKEKKQKKDREEREGDSNLEEF